MKRALAELGSRKGFEALLGTNRPPDDTLRAALEATRHPVTVAYLAPFLPATGAAARFRGMIGEVLGGPLLKAEPASARQLALVEAVRRLYKQNAIAADRADKEAARRG